MAKTPKISTVILAGNTISFIYNQSGSWDEAAEVFGVSKSILYGFTVSGYLPSDPQNRVKLGIDCRCCGKRHLPRYCPKKYKPIQKRTKKELLWSLENRKEM